MPRQSDPWKFLRTGVFLTASWIAARARTLLIINLVLAAGAIVITHRPGPDGRPVSVDFVSFHAAGALADAGHAALAYDRTAHGQAEAASIGPGHPYQFFFYPPPYLLLCAPLATLPYGVAFALFEALSLALFLLAMYALVGQLAPMRAWLPCVLAFTPLFWTIGLGQNAFAFGLGFGKLRLNLVGVGDAIGNFLAARFQELEHRLVSKPPQHEEHDREVDELRNELRPLNAKGLEHKVVT